MSPGSCCFAERRRLFSPPPKTSTAPSSPRALPAIGAPARHRLTTSHPRPALHLCSPADPCWKGDSTEENHKSQSINSSIKSFHHLPSIPSLLHSHSMRCIVPASSPKPTTSTGTCQFHSRYPPGTFSRWNIKLRRASSTINSHSALHPFAEREPSRCFSWTSFPYLFAPAHVHVLPPSVVPSFLGLDW